MLVLAVACRPGGPLVDDGADGADDADLPPSDRCGDDPQNAATLCLNQSTLDIPARGLHVGDIDGDGNLDLAYFTAGGVELTVWLGDGDGRFTSTDPISLPGAGIIQHLAELDGKPGTDVLTIGANGELTAFLNDGVGGFSTVVVSDPGPSAPWNFPIVADLDLDGRADVLAQPLADPTTWHVLSNAGDGSFEATGVTAPSDEFCYYTNHALMPAFSGFGGGLVIVEGECGGNQPGDRHLTLTWTRTNGEFLAALGPPPGDSPGAIAVGEFGSKGTPDAIIWDLSAHAFRHYRSGFSGAFELHAELSWDQLCPECGVSPSAPKLWAGHMDPGEVADLIIGANDMLYIGVDPLGESPQWATFPIPATRVVVADFNNDGRDDLVIEVVANEPCILLLSAP